MTDAHKKPVAPALKNAGTEEADGEDEQWVFPDM